TGAGATVSMRSKEEAHDYRYFPEPDLPPLVVNAARRQAIEKQMPALPAERRRLLVETHGLSMKDALQLGGGKGRYFDEMVTVWKAPPKPAANLVMGVLSTKLNELKSDDITQIKVSPEQSARLLALTDEGKISATIAKDVWLKAFD